MSFPNSAASGEDSSCLAQSDAEGGKSAAGAGNSPSPQFDDRQQEYSASKLGMWIFLCTEILLFAGLFCVYAIYRANHPDVFRFGSQFLDTGWGAINTAVLLISSFTMAMAVRCAQLSDRRGLKLFLALTLFLGFDFMGVKWIEYRHKIHEGILPGSSFTWGSTPAAPPGSNAPSGALIPGDPDHGRKLFYGTCAACHGLTGENPGLPGISLQKSKFIRARDQDAMVAYIERGRSIDDPLNTTRQAMLPKGGNPRLTKQDLIHIVSFLRILQSRSDQPPAAAGAVSAVAKAPAANVNPAASDRPPNLHLFLSVYYGMTGLHGIHVLAGMIVITWLLVRACRGEFSRTYFFPVEMGGLYWHLVDVIWIYLFPLLYLIS